jgi:hypothetical protein
VLGDLGQCLAAIAGCGHRVTPGGETVFQEIEKQLVIVANKDVLVPGHRIRSYVLCERR